MTRVLGVELEGKSTAYVYGLLASERVINESLGEQAIVVFWKPGTASAIDVAAIAEGRDVGTTGVFLRSIEGQTLTFRANEDGTFQDEETGSTWDILGQAIGGSMAGNQLKAIPHHDTFWFAWAAFVPDSHISISDPQD
jgi:hypothetical protein